MMFRLSKRPKEFAVRVCERCARVYDANCRRLALRERVLLESLRLGVRV